MARRQVVYIKLTGVLVLVLLVGCKPLAPITPKGCYIEVRRNYISQDVEMLYHLLSKDSKERLKKGATLWTLSKLKQRRSNIQVSRGQILGYLKNYFQTKDGRIARLKFSSDPLAQIKVVDNSRATIYLQSGYTIQMVKEGPYWRYVLP